MPYLLDLQVNKMLIEAATMFCNKERAVFRFRDIEVTPLFEEIGGFAGLPWDRPSLLVPENCTTRGFLKMMGLKKNDDLECLKNSYIPFDFFYER